MKRKFIGWSFDGDTKYFYLFWMRLIKRNGHKVGLKSLTKEIEYIKTAYFPALANHPSIFGSLRNIHEGQDIVIVGTGPTLDKYKPIPGAIHMGVNRAILDSRIEFDYHVCLDNPLIEDDLLINYRPGKCKKLYGLHHSEHARFSETLIKKCNADRFYFEVYSALDKNKQLPIDIAHLPIRVSVSVISAAFQIALWCHPRRIYIVGCDCAANGYTKADNGKVRQWLPVMRLKTEWELLAAFAKRMYPDIEIISINPVGLKGLFHDTYTNDSADAAQ